MKLSHLRIVAQVGETYEVGTVLGKIEEPHFLDRAVRLAQIEGMKQPFLARIGRIRMVHPASITVTMRA